MPEKTTIYFEEDGNIDDVKGKKITVVGYGNQGRAQALNMKESGLEVIIGNKDDDYKKTALSDGFEVFDIPEAVKKADIVFILTPDETMPELYTKDIEPNLKDGACINFASGYNIAFDLIVPSEKIDVIMIAPRMIGVGVRENYLSGEGYFSFICVHQDSTGKAENRVKAIGIAIGSGYLFPTTFQTSDHKANQHSDVDNKDPLISTSRSENHRLNGSPCWLAP